MKPSKKLIKQTPKKNQVATGIETFFKSAPKDFIVEEKVAEINPNNGAKKFFVDVLKERLQSIRDKENENRSNDIGHQVDGASANAVIIEKEVVSEGHDSKSTTECAGCAQKAIERDEWKEKYNQEVEKRKELKKVYVNTTISFTELYSKYNALLKTSASTHQSVDDAASSGQDIFTPAEVKFLQCTSLEKKTDCTFINHCLKYAYKVDRSVLVFKTLKGTSEWTEINGEGVEIQHAAKTPLTPKKVERIKGLFYERLSKCEIDAVEYSERIKDSYVNKLIAAGIKNLSKKFK